MMSERQDEERRARIDLSGLVFCSVDAPEIAPDRGYTPTPANGLRLADGEGAAPGAVLPATPEGCFLHRLYVNEWNRFIHVCARNASLTWLDPASVPAQGHVRALFPGDEIPDS